MSAGYKARNAMITAHQATMAQATGRQRVEGNWPSGNSSGSSANAARAGHGIQFPTQPTAAELGSGVPELTL